MAKRRRTGVLERFLAMFSSSIPGECYGFIGIRGRYERLARVKSTLSVLVIPCSYDTLNSTS